MLINGEKLAKTSKRLKDSLELLGIDSNQDQMLDSNKVKLQLTISRMSSVSSPIRPLNGFDLTFSTSLTCNGLLITYIVILLQFKFAEMY